MFWLLLLRNALCQLLLAFRLLGNVVFDLLVRQECLGSWALSPRILILEHMSQLILHFVGKKVSLDGRHSHWRFHGQHIHANDSAIGLGEL